MADYRESAVHRHICTIFVCVRLCRGDVVLCICCDEYYGFSFLLSTLTMRQTAFALEGTEKAICLSHIIIKIFPVKENLCCLKNYCVYLNIIISQAPLSFLVLQASGFQTTPNCLLRPDFKRVAEEIDFILNQPDSVSLDTHMIHTKKLKHSTQWI